MKRFARLRTLGSEFTEENLKAVISGDRQFSISDNVEPMKSDEPEEKDGLNLLIDLDRALQEKGKGYQIWAKRFNTKQMAATLNFLTENKLTDYAELSKKVSTISGDLQDKMTRIKEIESRLADIKEIQTHIVNYSKTKDVYKAYHKSGYSSQFKEQNITEILLYQSAKEFFYEKNFQPRPQMADLKKEFATLTAEKRKTYGEYNELKKINKDILNAKANIEVILDIDKEQQRKEQEKNDKKKENSL